MCLLFQMFTIFPLCIYFLLTTPNTVCLHLSSSPHSFSSIHSCFFLSLCGFSDPPDWLKIRWHRRFLSQPSRGVSSSRLSSVQIHCPVVYLPLIGRSLGKLVRKIEMWQNKKITLDNRGYWTWRSRKLCTQNVLGKKITFIHGKYVNILFYWLAWRIILVHEYIFLKSCVIMWS